MRFRNLTLCCIALAILGPVVTSHAGSHAGGVHTLESLQQAAFENRDLVRQYQADLDIRTQQEIERKGVFLPSVDLGYTMNRLNHDTAAGETRENDSFQAGVTWNAFAGFRDQYNLKAARHLTGQSRFMLDAIHQDISLNVALELLGIYRSMENLKVSQNEIKLYQDRLRQIRLKYKVGVLKKNDVLRVKVELDNAVQNERRAASLVKSGFNSLSFETGLNLKEMDLDFSFFDTLPPGKKDIKSQRERLLQRSDIMALKETLEAARMNAGAAKADFYPSVDTSLTYASHTSPDYFLDSFTSTADEIRFQATVSMNLFDGMQKYARVSQSRLEEGKVNHRIRELRANLETQLKNILLDLTVALDNLKVAESGTLEAQESLRVTDLGFNQGIVTSSDVLDSIYSLSRARFNLISAYTQVFENHFRLQRLVEQF